MRHPVTGLCLFFLAYTAASATNVSISVAGEVAPGVYGRVDIGNAPPPVVYAQPMIVTRRAGPPVAPVYLHVPPGHAKKWDKHCHKYNACNQPVYFVRSAEYDEPGHKGGKGKGNKPH